MFWLLLLVLILAAAAIRAHDFLEGETLIPDLYDELRLALASIDRLDRFCAANPDRSPIVVSLTTIPSRLPFIEDTLKSLLRQSRAPAAIRLNLPSYCEREQTAYVVPPWLRGLKSVTLVDCADHGPATKLIPALAGLPPDQAILVVDDDRIYPADLIAGLEAAAARLPEAALGLSGWLAPPDLVDRPTTLAANIFERPPTPIRARRLRAPRAVDILQGMSGYLVKPRYFDIAALTDYTAAPPAARFVDDVWISAHCRVAKYVIPARRSNFQPYRRAPFYGRTSLGRLNRGGGKVEERNNTIMLKHLAHAWRVGGAP